MFVAELENLRIRVTERTNAGLTRLSEARKISKQDAIEALLVWFLDLDEMLQAMILGQVPDTYGPDVVKLVLRRLADGESRVREPKITSSGLPAPHAGAHAKPERQRR